MAAQGGGRPDPLEVSGLAGGQPAGRAAPAGPGGGGTAYLRVTRGRFEPARAEELVRLSQEIAAAVARLPGCGGYHGGLDRAAGTLVAVSTWDSADHARFPREALGAALTRTLALGVQLEPPEIYEVVASA
jgi:quinol monooxygenase YgiN